MWFFAEFLERYTRNIARSIMRVAATEVEANRRALANLGIIGNTPNRLILPERQVTVPPAFVAERRAVASAEVAPPEFAAASDTLDVGAADAALRGADEAKVAKTLLTLEAMPMGVRGELVLQYIERLSQASAQEAGALIDKLSKDKKVRIAELQLIVADVLGEEVTRRKKTDHVDALREALGVPAPVSMMAAPAAPELRAH